MSKGTANFFLSLLIVGIYFGAGYYYFECHSMMDIFVHRKWITFSVYFSLAVGTLFFLYAMISQKGWNSLLYFISWFMNLTFFASLLYSVAEYGTLWLRGKIMLFSAAIVALSVLQTILFFVLKKKSRGISK